MAGSDGNDDGGAAGSGSGATRFAILAGVGVVIAVAVWLVLGSGSVPGPGPADGPGQAANGLEMPAPIGREAVPPALRVKAPAQQIAENGRLRVTAAALREGDVLALGLAMPDVARGSDARAVKVADVSGRVIDVEGVAVDGAGSGLRIEIDPDWLEPGTYLIQVQTAEATPLPVRRYVLDVVRDAPAAE